MTARIAFRMQLNAGQAAEYRRRHEAVPAALKNLLKDAGISDYSIFLDPQTHALFAVLRREDAARVEALAGADIMQAWWRDMADIMVTGADHAPVTVVLEEMFYLA